MRKTRARSVRGRATNDAAASLASLSAAQALPLTPAVARLVADVEGAADNSEDGCEVSDDEREESLVEPEVNFPLTCIILLLLHILSVMLVLIPRVPTIIVVGESNLFSYRTVLFVGMSCVR